MLRNVAVPSRMAALATAVRSFSATPVAQQQGQGQRQHHGQHHGHHHRGGGGFRGRGGGDSGWRGGRGGRGRGAKPAAPVVPMKDTVPFPGAQDGAENICVLVDAAKVPAANYPGIDLKVAKRGHVCLRRYFSVEADPQWAALDAIKGTQWFRVDCFIPVNMQLAADATHILDHRGRNKATALCFVVDAAEVEPYRVLLENYRAYNVRLLLFDHGGKLHTEITPTPATSGAP